MTNPPKIRNDPYASVSKLAEYTRAGAIRRRSILKRLKFPGGFPPRWYAGSRPAIARAIAAADSSCLLPVALSMRGDSSGTDHQQQLRGACVTALDKIIDEELLDLMPDFAGAGLAARAFEVAHKHEKLGIAGVTVSVAPDVIAESEDGRIGLVKVYLNQTHGLTKETGEMVATLLELHAEKHYSSKSVDRKHMVVLDVFGGNAFFAPKSLKRKRAELTAVCEEMADRWSAIKP